MEAGRGDVPGKGNESLLYGLFEQITGLLEVLSVAGSP